MSEDDADAWTTEGYGSVVLALDLPTRFTPAGMACPRWAGTLVTLLSPELTEEHLRRVVRTVQHHPHRDRLVLVAKLGGWAALFPMVEEWL